MKDLAYQCAKYFAEDAIQIILNIKGYSTELKCLDSVLEFHDEIPFFLEYELYFAKAVSIAFYKFNNEVKECSSAIWEDILTNEEEKRKHECFRRILQSAPKYYDIFPEKIFIFMAAIGELCVSCYAFDMEHLIPMALLAARCFLTRILKWVSPDMSLNILVYIKRFLCTYED